MAIPECLGSLCCYNCKNILKSSSFSGPGRAWRALINPFCAGERTPIAAVRLLESTLAKRQML